MKHIANFSTGASSAIATDRVLQRYGKEAVEVVFCDTTWEDEDNYRFMADCEARWGITITVLCDGRNPMQVGTDAKLIPNQRIGKCTIELKANLARAYEEQQAKRGPVTVHVGYDLMEQHRADKLLKWYEQYEGRISVDFPLMWKPYPFPPYQDIIKHEWGIEPPQMYALGYTHANCHGTCLKQGHGDWMRTLRVWPERYKEVEEWEAWMRAEVISGDYSILRDRTGGTLTTLTLAELRGRYERQEADQGLLQLLDEQTGSCIHCDAGAFAELEEVCQP